MRRLTQLVVPVLAFTVVASAGCGTTREAQYRSEQPAAVDESAKGASEGLIAEGDAAWEQRKDKAQLELAIAKWTEAAAGAPSGELYVKLSRAHYFLGDAWYAVEGDAEKRDAHYTEGLTWAEKAMGMVAPDFVAAVEGGEDHETAILKAPPEAVPAMYWQATNLGKWAASKGFATRLKYKDSIAATMKHVKSLDENFFYAAPWRYFGAFEAATAGLAGGDLEKSKANFEKSIEMAPAYLGTKVLFATYYCTKAQNKELYEKLLNEVIAADPAVDPAIEPENIREIVKAKQALAAIDEEF
jgi:tetratricopeptide (TPR) repeat protein